MVMGYNTDNGIDTAQPVDDDELIKDKDFLASPWYKGMHNPYGYGGMYPHHH